MCWSWGGDRLDQIEFVNLADPDIDIPPEPQRGPWKQWADAFMFGKSKADDRSAGEDTSDQLHIKAHTAHAPGGRLDDGTISALHEEAPNEDTSGCGDSERHARLEVAELAWDDPNW